MSLSLSFSESLHLSCFLSLDLGKQNSRCFCKTRIGKSSWHSRHRPSKRVDSSGWNWVIEIIFAQYFILTLWSSFSFIVVLSGIYIPIPRSRLHYNYTKWTHARAYMQQSLYNLYTSLYLPYIDSILTHKRVPCTASIRNVTESAKLLKSMYV